MQLIGEGTVESELLKDTGTTGTVADAEDGTVEIQDDVVGGLELVVVARIGELLGRVRQRLEREARGAFVTPWGAEALAMGVIDGQGGDAQAVSLGIEEREPRGAQVVAAVLLPRIMGVLFTDLAFP